MLLFLPFLDGLAFWTTLSHTYLTFAPHLVLCILVLSTRDSVVDLLARNMSHTEVFCMPFPIPLLCISTVSQLVENTWISR